MRETTEQRLRRLSDRSGECWLWLGKIVNGYGQVVVSGGRYRRAHRVSYEVFVGPIPEDLEIDHLCNVRACINPDHLEVVTHAENVRRSIPAIRKAARKRALQTHCKRGHEFTEANTYRPPKHPATRSCVACQRVREAARRERERAARQAK